MCLIKKDPCIIKMKVKNKIILPYGLQFNLYRNTEEESASFVTIRETVKIKSADSIRRKFSAIFCCGSRFQRPWTVTTSIYEMDFIFIFSTSAKAASSHCMIN